MFPSLNFRKTAGDPSTDLLNMLGRPTEQFFFIHLLKTNSADQASIPMKTKYIWKNSNSDFNYITSTTAIVQIPQKLIYFQFLS